jgi:hypothetical protein
MSLLKDPTKVAEIDSFPYHLWNSKTGEHEGYSTLDGARAALLAWISQQRQAGEVVLETDTGQWRDSRVTRWIADRKNTIIKLEAVKT